MCRTLPTNTENQAIADKPSDDPNTASIGIYYAVFFDILAIQKFAAADSRFKVIHDHHSPETVRCDKEHMNSW